MNSYSYPDSDSIEGARKAIMVPNPFFHMSNEIYFIWYQKSGCRISTENLRLIQIFIGSSGIVDPVLSKPCPYLALINIAR